LNDRGKHKERFVDSIIHLESIYTASLNRARETKIEFVSKSHAMLSVRPSVPSRRRCATASAFGEKERNATYG